MRNLIAVMAILAFASGALATQNMCAPDFNTCAPPDGAFLLASRLVDPEGIEPDVHCGPRFLLCRSKCAQEHVMCARAATSSLAQMRCNHIIDCCLDDCVCLD